MYNYISLMAKKGYQWIFHDCMCFLIDNYVEPIIGFFEVMLVTANIMDMEKRHVLGLSIMLL